MNPIRALYDRFSVKTRTAIRSILPDQFKRWYAHKNTDVYLISYPKCGRTWLRLMIGRAVILHYNLPETEDTLLLRWKKRPHPELPRITVIHEDRPMRKSAQELERSKTRYRNKKIIFLVRDPRDVLVSSYFEMSKRGEIFGDNPYTIRKPTFNGSLTEFTNKQVGGYDTILAYYNIWADNRRVPQDFLLVRYEDIKADPTGELRKVIDFLELKTISDDAIAEAVDYGSFDNMRKMETENKFQSGILNPADKKDESSYKTRKGEVGGYMKYLNEKEIEILNRKIQEDLSDFFGYTP